MKPGPATNRVAIGSKLSIDATKKTDERRIQTLVTTANQNRPGSARWIQGVAADVSRRQSSRSRKSAPTDVRDYDFLGF